MKKLSQRELLVEGFGTNLLKQVARGVGQAATFAAKAISPTAVKVAAAAADKVGSALQTTFSSPSSALKEYFKRPEVSSKYSDFTIIKTGKGQNRKIVEIDFYVVDVKTGKKRQATATARRTDKGGLSKEEWSFDKFKFDNGEEVIVGGNNSKESKSSSNVPEEVKPVGDDSDTKRAFNLTKRLAVGSGSKQAEIGAVEPLNRDEMEGFDKEFLAKFKQKVKVQKDGRVSMDGFRFSKNQVDELFKESKKSQKSLLKHLQSMSR